MEKLPTSLVRFEAFLREAENRAGGRPVLNWTHFLRFVSFVAFVILIGHFLIEPTNILRIILIVGMSGFLSKSVFYKLEDGRKSRLSRRDPLHLTYVKLIEELKKYSEKRTLGERLHPAVARRLESVADAYFRVRTWLKTPSSKNVLGNQLHRDVIQATESAMREVIFSIHGAYRPSGMERKRWQKLVDSDPDALETCNSLTRINSLLEQLTDIMTKVESMGATITLTDQLRAISEAIEEMEQSSYANIKSLPMPTKS